MILDYCITARHVYVDKQNLLSHFSSWLTQNTKQQEVKFIDQTSKNLAKSLLSNPIFLFLWTGLSSEYLKMCKDHF